MQDRHRKSRLRLVVRRLTRMLAAAVALAAVCVAAPQVSADQEPRLGREALIGKLIPITGDPLERRSVELRIGFRLDSAELTEEAMAQLRELGAALVSEALGRAEIGVYGHTDASGAADYNLALSERRAQAVAAFLQEQAGIAAERFREVRGYGEERLREELPPGAGAQRRVEIAAFHRIADDGAVSSSQEAETVGASDADGSGVAVQKDDEVTADRETGHDSPSGRGGGNASKSDGFVVVQ